MALAGDHQSLVFLEAAQYCPCRSCKVLCCLGQHRSQRKDQPTRWSTHCLKEKRFEERINQLGEHLLWDILVISRKLACRAVDLTNLCSQLSMARAASLTIPVESWKKPALYLHINKSCSQSTLWLVPSPPPPQSQWVFPTRLGHPWARTSPSRDPHDDTGFLKKDF